MRQPLNVPYDFDKDLPELKTKTFQWQADLHLHENDDISGTITHYSIGPAPRGNMILAPGLASNTNIEPLMKAITYWSMTNRYNVYCINTFLGDFKTNTPLAQIKKNTYSEFVNLMDMSLDIIEKHCAGTWTGLVGHSAGGTAAIEIFNRRIQAKKKPRVSAAILFAPPLLKSHTECQKILYRRLYHLQDISEIQFRNMPMNLANPHDFEQCNKIRYVSIMPQFLEDLVAQPLKFDLMDQWKIPVTIVAGARDRKVPMTELQSIYEQLKGMPNGNMFKFVVFQNSKHSFIDPHKYWDDVINLIKSQRIRKSR